jgi:Fe-S cluster biosynthesis and repair protein YggX
VDFLGRKINQRNPKCQNIDELRTAILQEWQQFPQERLRRLVRNIVTMTWQKWGSKQVLEKRKTSLSLMEVFNIALKCRIFRF